MSIVNLLFDELDAVQDELIYVSDLINRNHATIDFDVWIPYLRLLSDAYIRIDNLLIKSVRRIALKQLEANS